MIAQEKMIEINRILGLTGIKKQQFGTRIIYDSLPLDGRTVYEFFKQTNQRPFPLSNVSSLGSKLEQGESLACLFFSLCLISEFGGNWQKPVTITNYGNCGNILTGELEIIIQNQLVMKSIPLTSYMPNFNKYSRWSDIGGHEVFEFNTIFIIPPLMDYNFKIKLPAGIIDNDFILRMTVEGIGTILNTKQTF